MPVSVPPPPEKGDMLDPPCEHGDVITFLAKRRSVLARMMQEPGPDSEELKALLRLAVRVPDHGRLEPWRFLVIKDTARAQLGDILAQAWQKTRFTCRTRSSGSGKAALFTGPRLCNGYFTCSGKS